MSVYASGSRWFIVCILWVLCLEIIFLDDERLFFIYATVSKNLYICLVFASRLLYVAGMYICICLTGAVVAILTLS